MSTNSSPKGKNKKNPRGRPTGVPSKPIEKKQTKLAIILLLRGMSQSDLISIIKQKYHKTIGKDRMSRIINGMTRDYMLSTASMIAGALSVKIDDIIEQ